MARINAAYDLLRDAGRRARYDTSMGGRQASTRSDAEWAGRDSDFGSDGMGGAPFGPPPPPRTRPVTARFDTTTAFRPRNATLHGAGRPLRGHEPMPRHRPEERDLRASTPTGPVERRRGKRAAPPPTLLEARETVLNFGKYHGYTLGEVELLDPAYIDWIARTITRDRDMVIRARLIEVEMDSREVARPSRSAAAGADAQAAAG
jgi:curved DNA-binding protein CbpA